MKQIADYTFQFYLEKQQNYNQSHRWGIVIVGSWYLNYHQSLPVIKCINFGKEIGCFLGFPISKDGKLIRKNLHTSFPDKTNADDAIEEYIYNFGGRWIFVRTDSDNQRLYMDPCGTLAVVYDSECAASTTTLINPNSGFRTEWLGLEKTFPISNQFFPAGLTGEQNILRLLPNHYLDLESMKSVRHWPKDSIQKVTKNEVQGLVDKIVYRIRLNIEALSDESNLYCSLTAGRDSRMILSCCKNVIDKITCFTYNFNRGTGPEDVDVAKIICDRIGAEHLLVPIEEVNNNNKKKYLNRIGYSGNSGKAADFLQATGNYLSSNMIWMIGYAGEVGRSFYWMKGDKSDTKYDVENLLWRMNLPPTPLFKKFMEEWVCEFNDIDFFRLLDFMYLENRMGAWASPHLYGCAPDYNIIVPLCHREIIELMLRLPDDYRWRQKLADDVIKASWPELAAFPYQRTSGIAGLYRYFLERKLKPAVNSGIDFIGGLQGKNSLYDRLYIFARGIYRSMLRKQ
jgi:hypothetical protein